jgi:DNA polymerase III delta subunit
MMIESSKGSLPLTVRVFILWGEDTVSRERAREAIVAELSAREGPCSRERFDSVLESAASFIQRMLAPSLFQETRIFHLPHAQTLGGEDLDDLDAALSYDIPFIYCIIEIDADRKDAVAIIKMLHASERSAADPPTCMVREFARPRDYEIGGWLVENVPRFIGRRIARNDADYLADRVGYDLDLLNSELQKIDLILPPGKSIDRAAIDRTTGDYREMAPFELAAALGARDLPSALRIIDNLFSVNVYMPIVTAALARHFWALFRIRTFLEANPEVGRAFAASKGSNNSRQTASAMAIGKAAGLLRDGQEKRIYPVIIKSGVVDQANRFSEQELSMALGQLLDFDIGIKTGRIEPSRNTLAMLCFRIVRAKTAAKEFTPP